MKSATYSNTAVPLEKFAENLTYDKMGNIKTILREGLTATATYGTIDNLTFGYTGNQLLYITDAGPNVNLAASADFKDYSKVTTAEYAFNTNGAMTKDLNKGISQIQYNSLNLPLLMDIKSPVAEARNEYIYTATGTKLKVLKKWNPNYSTTPVIGATINTGSLTLSETTDYAGNKIYENGILKRILTDNGYIESGIYYFYIKDHLGNNRVVANASAGVIQSTQFYSFGMAFAEGTTTEQGRQPYKYNGKELDQAHGLNQYDYQARYYDPAYGRFTTMDPLSEKKPWLSPFIYCSNNPINRIDPDGMLDISKLIGNTHYGVVAVFPESRDRKLEDDYKAAIDAGIATIQVASINEFADGMSQMAGMGVTTDNYTLNSHGGQGYFYIGDQMSSNKISNKPANDFQDLGILKEGLSGKNVFIGSCNVTQDGNERGISTIKRFSKETNSTIISSDHLLTTKFKYDGSDYLSKPYSDIQIELQPELKNRVVNSYHLARPSKEPIQIYNFTIDQQGKFSWDTENKK